MKDKISHISYGIIGGGEETRTMLASQSSPSWACPLQPNSGSAQPNPQCQAHLNMALQIIMHELAGIVLRQLRILHYIVKE
jgi:hypothetical protein